jgi:hypothetical protein
MVPERQQARPAGREVDIGAAACACKVFADIDVAQVRSDHA